MVVSVNIGGREARGSWKLSPYWLELLGEPERIITKLEDFVRSNEGSTTMGIQWDTLKAFLRGILIQGVAGVKKKAREWEEGIRRDLEMAEKQFLDDPTPVRQKLWEDKQESYRIAVLRKGENRQLFQSQRVFGEGESVGRMLAYLVKTNCSSSTIPAIRVPNGEISSHSSEITDAFGKYYENLYRSQGRVGEEVMDTFFRNMLVPTITVEDKEGLDAPITLAELRQAVNGMANQKSPGPDGLPIETYRQYGKILLPELLKTLNWALEAGRLPDSMTETTIILLQKEGGNSLEPSAYRPISLLCTDAKILARVLPSRLNKTISKLIHSDQTGIYPPQDY